MILKFNQISIRNLVDFWVINSNYSNIENELLLNTNIINITGKLSNLNNYEYSCIVIVESYQIEINYTFTNSTYYLGISKDETFIILYSFQIFLNGKVFEFF